MAVIDFVIDNSVAAGWVLENQATAYSTHIARRLQTQSACAPALWEAELTNVLRTACIRQRLDAQRAQQMLLRIDDMSIEVDRHPVPRSELLALALRFGLTTYDAAYLELALRRQLPIATLDQALANAAMASGAGLVVLPVN